MEYSNKQFKEEIESTFNINFLKNERVPLDLGEYKFDLFPESRTNHYLIKSSDSVGYFFGEFKNTEIEEFVKFVSSKLSELGLEEKDRYCFMTVDQGWVEPGKTLRTSGWHLDGLQGDEVQIKKAVDFEFFWFDCLPTLFAPQPFDINGLNLSTHNVFDWLGRQVDLAKILEAKPFRIYGINPYHVHRANEAKEKVYRRFIRLAYTYIPVTSVRMTINPEMKYNYDYHTTSGEIPSYLK